MKNQKNSAKNISIVEIVEVEKVNNALLDSVNALGIAEKVKSNTNKSIFKKDHCNSASRGKCRKQFINAIGLYLLNSAHNKKELAEKNLSDARTIAKEYYSVEDKFENANDYFTNGRGGNDVETIKLFISEINK